jgi:hypothetical protein
MRVGRMLMGSSGVFVRLLGMLEGGGMISICMVLCCCVVGLGSVLMVLRCLLVCVVCHFDYVAEAVVYFPASLCLLHAKIDQCRINISLNFCPESGTRIPIGAWFPRDGDRMN